MDKIERGFSFMNEYQKNKCTYIENEGLVHHFLKSSLKSIMKENICWVTLNTAKNFRT